MMDRGLLNFLRRVGHQTYFPLGRFRLIRHWYDYDTTPPRSFSVDFFGLAYRGTFSSYVDWWVFFFGAYSAGELHFIKLLAQELRGARGAINMLDVGSNVGQHALFASQFFDQVFAVEPYPGVCRRIRDKIELNSVLNIRIFPVAFGHAAARLPFYLPSGRNEGVGSFVKTDIADNTAETFEVVNGDSHLADAGSPRIDFIKIDVEGFEHNVLAGLQRTLKEGRPVILMELSQMSREAFGSDGETALRSLLYPDHDIFEMKALTTDGRFELRPFDYATSSEIAVLPKEIGSAIRRTGFGNERLFRGRPAPIRYLE